MNMDKHKELSPGAIQRKSLYTTRTALLLLCKCIDLKLNSCILSAVTVAISGSHFIFLGNALFFSDTTLN